MTNLNLYILIIQTLVIVIIVVSFCFLCRMFTNFAEFYRVLTNIYFQSTTPTTTLHQLFPVFFLYILNIGSTFLPCMAQKRNPVTSLRFYKILWNSDIWWYLFYTSSLPDRSKMALMMTHSKYFLTFSNKKLSIFNACVIYYSSTFQINILLSISQT